MRNPSFDDQPMAARWGAREDQALAILMRATDTDQAQEHLTQLFTEIADTDGREPALTFAAAIAAQIAAEYLALVARQVE